MTKEIIICEELNKVFYFCHICNLKFSVSKEAAKEAEEKDE